ncbi:MAG: hypothetical protein ACM3II_13825 [Rhodospirillaceae bacterium]
MICTTSELIDALGGTGEVARRLGVKDNTVSTWRRNDRGLPGWACAPLRHALAEIGEQADPVLFEIRRPERAA